MVRRLSSVLLCLAVALALAFMVAPTVSMARPGGGAVVSFTFDSRALLREGGFHAYLPPGYDGAAPRAYPMIVALHGLGGNGRDWFAPDRGDLERELDARIARGELAPVVVVAPDGENGYWTDHATAERGARWGAFVAEVEHEAMTRLRIDPERVAVIGASMGGHGALSAALMRPERYRAAVAMAPALFPEPPTHRPIYLRVWGAPADLGHWARTAPRALLRRPEVARAAPPIWLQCGSGDVNRFLDWSRDGFEAFADAGLDVSLHLNPGGHGWTTWRAATPAWLPWLDQHLRR